ncbi:MAG: hypothetical protein IJO93_01470, partial [Clostridia bacterium]|nr:hypothetical protein [Clostridia bacterium]
MQQKLLQFLQGRYIVYARGSDSLNKFLTVAGFILLILSFILNAFKATAVAGLILSFAAMGVFGFAIFRMLSRSISRRQSENMRYIRMKDKFISFFKNGFKTDKEHKIFRCPSCRTRVRVPRGRGKIKIT